MVRTFYIFTFSIFLSIPRYYFNHSLFDVLDHRFQKLLWNFASVANVINPFLYAMYDYGPPIGCRYILSHLGIVYLHIFYRRSTNSGRKNEDNGSGNFHKMQVWLDKKFNLVYNLQLLTFQTPKFELTLLAQSKSQSFRTCTKVSTRIIKKL